MRQHFTCIIMPTSTNKQNRERFERVMQIYTHRKKNNGKCKTNRRYSSHQPHAICTHQNKYQKYVLTCSILCMIFFCYFYGSLLLHFGWLNACTRHSFSICLFLSFFLSFVQHPNEMKSKHIEWKRRQNYVGMVDFMLVQRESNWTESKASESDRKVLSNRNVSPS